MHAKPASADVPPAPSPSPVARSASVPPPAPLSPWVGHLAADFVAAGWTVSGCERYLGAREMAALAREQRTALLMAARAVEAGSPAHALALLTRLFVLGDQLSVQEVALALPRTTLAGALELGLLASQSAESARPAAYRATCCVAPHHLHTRDYWVASDLTELASGRALGADHVLGVGGASSTLAAWTIREAVAGGRHGAVADVGTGSGIQALAAAHRADGVLATDISERALRFARFNVALDEAVCAVQGYVDDAAANPRDPAAAPRAAGTSRPATIQTALGSLLEPLAGREFDLIVSNPPFVITPQDLDLPLMEYRDGGLGGDVLVSRLLAGLPAHLAPGGVAQLLANWEHHAGQEWSERVESWLPKGVSAWVIQREVLDPAQYVEMWLRDGGLDPRTDRAAYEASYERWLADFDRRGVDAIGFGQVILHRPARATDRTWRRIEDAPGLGAPDPAAHVLLTLRARAVLAQLDDASLAALPLRLSPDVVEERYYTPGAADPQLVRLSQGGGLARKVVLTTAQSAVVGACDGELPVGAIIAAVAQLLEVPAADVAGEVLGLLRTLTEDGLLLLPA